MNSNWKPASHQPLTLTTHNPHEICLRTCDGTVEQNFAECEAHCGEKAKLAELDSKYAAKIAEKEIAMKSEIDGAAAAGDFQKVEELQQHLSRERRSLQAELEEKKEQLRQAK